MINVEQLKAGLEKALAIASALDPRIAVASAGVNTLTQLFGAVTETNAMMKTILAETQETAPEVAAQVVALYASKEAEWDKSVEQNPGT